MVIFMVKWAIAAVPALLILMAAGSLAFMGISAVMAPTGDEDTAAAPASSLLAGIDSTAPAGSDPEGGWFVSESTDPMNDSRQVIAVLEATRALARYCNGH
jgi:hypothetical protein